MTIGAEKTAMPPFNGMAKETGRVNLDDDEEDDADAEGVVRVFCIIVIVVDEGADAAAAVATVAAAATEALLPEVGADLRGGIGGGMEVNAECGC